MIRRLRRAHRVLLPVLGLGSLAVFALSLRARVEWPEEPEPSALGVDADPLQAPGARAFPLPVRWQETEIELAARYLVDATPGAPLRTWIEVRPLESPDAPDVLVYVSPDAPEDGDLPEDSLLLGTLAGTQRRVFELPAVHRERMLDGHLILFSLGHGAVVGSGILELPQVVR